MPAALRYTRMGPPTASHPRRPIRTRGSNRAICRDCKWRARPGARDSGLGTRERWYSEVTGVHRSGQLLLLAPGFERTPDPGSRTPD